ncbi:hypothetical protein Aab01nite_51490 [Paractinoplanes abujensis]|uniref:Pyruvate,orthophosphate dikinase n=1 Tax=Paractinoplanes abujensis TaxID=882441 RepID=A0A7W7CUP4_9ACTN|nr:PEP/pyruvate-binding domain-containing protein [Actinoplanes abujensis]MBB4693785.1 pyruvate,orthophosphate dikinase [Actinoplanes abujensis]GID21559.1 hypothetical protein Aab01nite_51490 [Actinoplanes abujensis]
MIFEVKAALDEPADMIGAKAHGLVQLLRLGLPVPPAFVIGTPACRAYLRDGRLPDGLDAATDRLGAASVSVRSGAAVSMPGMMNTVLDVRGPIAPAVRDVFASWHTPRAVTYRALHGIPHDAGTAVIVQTMVHGDRDDHSGSGVAFSRDPGTGHPTPYGDVLPRHRGDAVVSGAFNTSPPAVLASREPAVWSTLTAALTTLEQHYRDACHVEFTYESGHLWLLQVRPGGLTPRALVRVTVDLADEGLIDRREAVRRITPSQLRAAATPHMVIRSPDAPSPPERATAPPHGRPAPAGAPQPPLHERPAPAGAPQPPLHERPAPAGAVESPHAFAGPAGLVARGRGASPGVVTGRVALTAEAAVRMRGPVVLVRPETSPLDMHGLATAVGVVTARGGLASHAAVVARALRKPAVVGASGLHALAEGTEITIDGSSGEIALGAQPFTTAAADPHIARLLAWADTISGDHSPRPAEARLAAARALL